MTTPAQHAHVGVVAVPLQMDDPADDDDDAPYYFGRTQWRWSTQPGVAEALAASYAKCPHPTLEERKRLAAMAGVAPVNVRVWFQNRRQRDKRAGVPPPKRRPVPEGAPAADGGAGAPASDTEPPQAQAAPQVHRPARRAKRNEPSKHAAMGAASLKAGRGRPVQAKPIPQAAAVASPVSAAPALGGAPGVTVRVCTTPKGHSQQVGMHSQGGAPHGAMAAQAHRAAQPGVPPSTSASCMLPTSAPAHLTTNLQGMPVLWAGALSGEAGHAQSAAAGADLMHDTAQPLWHPVQPPAGDSSRYMLPTLPAPLLPNPYMAHHHHHQQHAPWDYAHMAPTMPSYNPPSAAAQPYAQLYYERGVPPPTPYHRLQSADLPPHPH